MAKSKSKSKGRTTTETKSREDLLLQKRLSDLQLAMLEDSSVQASHIGEFSKVSQKHPGLEIQDPIYIRENLELMTLWLECAKKTVQATIIMNDDTINSSIAHNLQNSDYVTYVENVVNFYKQ